LLKRYDEIIQNNAPTGFYWGLDFGITVGFAVSTLAPDEAQELIQRRIVSKRDEILLMIEDAVRDNQLASVP
jgi:hypothetical protein